MKYEQMAAKIAEEKAAKAGKPKRPPTIPFVPYEPREPGSFLLFRSSAVTGRGNTHVGSIMALNGEHWIVEAKAVANEPGPGMHFEGVIYLADVRTAPERLFAGAKLEGPASSVPQEVLALTDPFDDPLPESFVSNPKQDVSQR